MTMLFRWMLSIGLILLTACSVPKPRPNIYDLNPDTSIIALVLGEGMARSFAHVGVLKALEEESIPIHLIVGSGMGAFMASLYANKKSANDMEWHAMALKRTTYLRFQFENFLKTRLIHSKLEKLPIPTLLIATDLKTGERVILEEGAIIPAIEGCVAIPGFSRPQRYQDKALVSSEISHGIPVDIAQSRGADLIIAVDLTQGIERYGFRDTDDITLQSYKITSKAHSERQLKQAHIVIRPDMSGIDFLDFSQKRKAMLAGYEAAEKVMPELKKILQLQEDE